MELNTMVTFDVLVLQALLLTLAMIVMDTLLGILLAFANKEFDLRVLPDFLRSSILPYVGALVIMAVATTVLPQMVVIFYFCAAAANLKFLTDIKDKLEPLFGKIDDQSP